MTEEEEEKKTIEIAKLVDATLRHLHNHPKLERDFGIDDDHVIIDKDIFQKLLGKSLQQSMIDGVFTTKSIVNELSKREGVTHIEVAPHIPYEIRNNRKTINEWVMKSTGPARILVVTD